MYISTDGWVQMSFQSCIILSRYLYSTVHVKILVMCVCVCHHVVVVYSCRRPLCCPSSLSMKGASKRSPPPTCEDVTVKTVQLRTQRFMSPGGLSLSRGPLWPHARPRQCIALRDEMIRLDYRVIISDTSQA